MGTHHQPDQRTMNAQQSSNTLLDNSRLGAQSEGHSAFAIRE
jgi:hypothetical protein